MDKNNKKFMPEKTCKKFLTAEEKEKRITEIEKRIAQIKLEVLTGKCPIRFNEMNPEQIDWKNPILREPYNTWQDPLKHLTGTTDVEIAGEIFTKGLYALSGKSVARNANVALQSLAGAAPKDATEARLCLQANALYSQGMTYLSRAEQNYTLPQCEFYIKNAMKLLRLHNETIEALDKYQRRGEQRILVQHVSIEGQAIVNNGNMIAGGGGVK